MDGRDVCIMELPGSVIEGIWEQERTLVRSVRSSWLGWILSRIAFVNERVRASSRRRDRLREKGMPVDGPLWASIIVIAIVK